MFNLHLKKKGKVPIEQNKWLLLWFGWAERADDVQPTKVKSQIQRNATLVNRTSQQTSRILL